MISMKENTYEDYLESCIAKSMTAFERAKDDAIYFIGHADYYKACEHANIFMEYIDQITKYATRIKVYEHILKKYNKKKIYNKDNVDMDNFEDSMKVYIEQSMNYFEQSKCDTINYIRNMDCYDATEFGASVMSKIDWIIKHGTQVRTYELALRKCKEKNGDAKYI